MSSISVALSLFAVALLLAQVRGRAVRTAWLAGLALGLYLLPGSAQVAAPLGTILALGLRDSVAGLRPRQGYSHTHDSPSPVGRQQSPLPRSAAKKRLV